ncbi:MAG: hypothetical protein EOM73_17085, partial [Bacteroidia bacterium]|nr:hypothetical protein [Bacteroidia bacterium]
MLLMSVSVCSFACYESDWSNWNYYTITQNWGTNVKTTKDTNLSVKLLSSQPYNSFGYFTFNNHYNILTKEKLTFDSNGVANLGNFDNNTRVGFWLETASGTVYSLQNYNAWAWDAGEIVRFDASGNPVYQMGAWG